MGRGDGEEGTPKAPEGGVGGGRGSVLSFPPRTGPHSRRFGAARSPILQNPGWGRERSRGARPLGCQADVVGHLKFTEGGGRVKVMVSRARAVCGACAFPLQTGGAIDLPLAKYPRRCLPGERGGGAGGSGARPAAPCSRAAAEVASTGACRQPAPQTFLFLSPSRNARSRRTGLGLCFFSPSFRKKKMPLCSPFSPAR